MASVLGVDIGSTSIKYAILDYSYGRDQIDSIRLGSLPLSLAMESSPDISKSLRILNGDYSAIGLTATPLLFRTYAQGIREIFSEVDRIFPTIPVYVPMCDGKIELKDEIKDIYQAVSSNYVPTAIVASQLIENGFMVDTGGSTTDINVIENGRVKLFSSYSWDRLSTGEAVSIGMNTTPLSGLLNQIRLNGKEYNIPLSPIALATTSEMLFLLGKINESEYISSADSLPYQILRNSSGKEMALEKFAKSLGSDLEWIKQNKKEHEILDVAMQMYQAAVDMIHKCIERLKINNFNGFDLKGIIAGSGKYVLSKPALEMSGINSISDMSPIFGKDLINSNEESAACLALVVARL